MDGTITAVVVGSLLALAQGLCFRAVAALVAPILLVQIGAIRGAGFSLAPAPGLELSIVGMLGLVVSARGRGVHRAVAKYARRISPFGAAHPPPLAENGAGMGNAECPRPSAPIGSMGASPSSL